MAGDRGRSEGGRSAGRGRTSGVGSSGGALPVLFGFMGSGKTSVGRRLAARLRVSFTDADHVIVAEQGRSIREIFEADGEAAFREIEHQVIVRLLAEQHGVLALGGGAVMHPGTQELLRAHPLAVHLKISLEQALARCGDDPARPMLRRPDLPEIHARRMAAYDAVAGAVITTDGLDGDQVCAAVLRLVEQRRAAGSAAQL